MMKAKMYLKGCKSLEQNLIRHTLLDEYENWGPCIDLTVGWKWPFVVKHLGSLFTNVTCAMMWHMYTYRALYRYVGSSKLAIFLWISRGRILLNFLTLKMTVVTSYCHLQASGLIWIEIFVRVCFLGNWLLYKQPWMMAIDDTFGLVV